jgi:hypothetical protein
MRAVSAIRTNALMAQVILGFKALLVCCLDLAFVGLVFSVISYPSTGTIAAMLAVAAGISARIAVLLMSA